MEGYDLVRLERESSGDPFLKRMGSKMYAALIRRYVCPNYPPNGFDVIMFHEKVRNQKHQLYLIKNNDVDLLKI